MGLETSVEVTLAPIVDERGVSAGVVVVFRGVSERRIAREALRQEHDLLQTVIEGVSDMIFLKNVEGRYLMVNKAASEILGRSESEIIGRRDGELFGPVTANLMLRSHQQALATSEVQIFECGITSRGQLRPYLVSSQVCRNAEGKAVGVLGIGRDVTLLKKKPSPDGGREG